MTADRDSTTNRPLAPAEVAEQVASLRTVGGVYDYVAACVEYDNTPTTNPPTAAALAAGPETEFLMHDQNHLDCCSHCSVCHPPEERSEAALRAAFGRPLFEMDAEVSE